MNANRKPGSSKGVSREAIKKFIGDKSTAARINITLKNAVKAKTLIQVLKGRYKVAPVAKKVKKVKKAKVVKAKKVKVVKAKKAAAPKAAAPKAAAPQAAAPKAKKAAAPMAKRRLLPPRQIRQLPPRSKCLLSYHLPCWIPNPGVFKHHLLRMWNNFVTAYCPSKF